MKNNNYVIRLFTTGFICLMITGLAACSDSSLSGSKINSPSTEISNLKSTVVGGGSPSTQFVLSPMAVSNVEDGGNGPVQIMGTSGEQTVTSSISQVDPQTTVIAASADGQNSEPQEYTINDGNASARHLTTDVTYSGGSMINYTVRDQPKTASLNQHQEDLLSSTQQQLNTAQVAYNNMPAKVENSNPLMNKSDQQIKNMLETKGFSVTVIGDKRFELTKTEGDVVTTRAFNAESFSEETYEIHYQGNEGYGTYFDNGTIHTKQSVN